LRAKVVMSASDWVVRAFRGANVNDSLGVVAGRAEVYWGSNDAIDVVADLSQLPVLGENADVELVDYLRVDARWPKLGVDVLVGDIPATSGILDVAVSFTKGCYPGQELVERMSSRGASAPVEVRVMSREGLGVGARIEKDGVTVGTVTSVGPTLALARVARGSEVGEPLSATRNS
jgi:folate-binding protein YgfZ